MTIPEAPKPRIDPPEPPHPDQQDTISPGLTDESGLLPIDPESITASPDGGATNAFTDESPG